MDFKIPFTNIGLNLSLTKTGSGLFGKRPTIATRRYSASPGRDLTGYKADRNLLYSIYKNNADVRACIREWRQNVGAAGYRWRMPDSDDDPEKGLVSELESILNFETTWRMKQNRIVRDLGVCDNAYLAFVKNVTGERVIGVLPVDPRTLSVVIDEEGVIHRYIQRLATSRKTVVYRPEEIIHFKTDSDPDFEHDGLSPMESIIWDARTDTEAMLTNYFFYVNNAAPAVQYVLEGDLDEEQIDKAVDLIEKNFKGSKNRGKASVISGVKEIKSVTLSQKDAQHLESRQFTTEKIASAYGVSKFHLGYTDKVNNNNAVELLQKGYDGTFKPLEDSISEVMNVQFVERLSLEKRIEYEYLPQIFNQAEIEKRAIEEYRTGLITLRQYKLKTGQDITPEDESNPLIDTHVFHQGASAVLPEDIGVDPVIDPNNPEVAENLVKALKTVS